MILEQESNKEMIQLFEQSYDVYFSYVAPIHAKERYHIPKIKH